MRRGTARTGTIAFSFLVPAAVGGWVPWLLPHAAPASAPVWAWLGLVPVAAGALVYVACAREFARQVGTPLPGADTEAVVVQGPYRWVRNPMYLGVLLAILGWAVLLRSPAILVYGLAVACLMHAFVVLVEEPRLARRFGDGYALYQNSVSRWRPARPR